VLPSLIAQGIPVTVRTRTRQRESCLYRIGVRMLARNAKWAEDRHPQIAVVRLAHARRAGRFAQGVAKLYLRGNFSNLQQSILHWSLKRSLLNSI